MSAQCISKFTFATCIARAITRRDAGAAARTAASKKTRPRPGRTVKRPKHTAATKK